jgi:hypothetical protein
VLEIEDPWLGHGKSGPDRLLCGRMLVPLRFRSLPRKGVHYTGVLSAPVLPYDGKTLERNQQILFGVPTGSDALGASKIAGPF